MRGALIAGLLGLTGTAAATDFSYDPKPRWAEDPDTDVVCDAIRAECQGILKNDKIEGEWSYAELYDADGMLVGVRSLKSTGCKPLDEHMLLGERHFTQAFTKPGQPDLDSITAELAPGTPKDAVRLVKRERRRSPSAARCKDYNCSPHEPRFGTVSGADRFAPRTESKRGKR